MSSGQQGKFFIELLISLSGLAISGYLGWRTLKYLTDGPQPANSTQSKRRSKQALQQLGIPSSITNNLSAHEQLIAAQLLMPDQLDVSGFEDICGYEDVMEDLQDYLLTPLQASRQKSKALSNSQRVTLQADQLEDTLCPGILLYGPPGCGKTLLAKAVAKTADVAFINVTPALLLDRLLGESEKLVEALFSLAHKVAPCIIFMDEIDALLSCRPSTSASSSSSSSSLTPSAVGGNGELMSGIKAQMLALWDGINATESDGASKGGRVVIVGATNRPGAIDAAFMRRMPVRIKVDLPDEEQRYLLFRKCLSGRQDVRAEEEVLRDLAFFADGHSCSDIVETCRAVLGKKRRQLQREEKRAEEDKKEDKRAEEKRVKEWNKDVSKKEVKQLIVIRTDDFVDAIARNKDAFYYRS